MKMVSFALSDDGKKLGAFYIETDPDHFSGKEVIHIQRELNINKNQILFPKYKKLLTKGIKLLKCVPA